MEFLAFFGGVFEPYAFGVLVFGTLFGLVFGAMPGLSPTLTVALLIPFTLGMGATHGLILLGAAYTSTVAGGAVSAILLKIPGAPANIATALDGNAMAKNGEGTRALHLSFLSSGVGGVIGIFLLIFLTPLLAKAAREFDAQHLFWLAILGVTVIGSLDTKSFVKGLLSGCIGLWISTIGYDDQLGTARFIFHDSLEGGVNVVPALIGLFAIPQVIDMFASGRNNAVIDVVKAKAHSLKESVQEIKRSKKMLTIGTVIGSVIGVIPGVGGQVAGLLAYDQAQKFSKDKAKFGTGHAEGLIAAESANNAMVGPSLVPMLTLGIPGSPTAAVLIGGLTIHEIFPGGDIFTKNPEVIWTFVNSMLIGQILMVVFGIFTAVYVAKIARAPKAAMAPIVLVLALFGAYSIGNSMGDVYVMLVLGLAMYFLEKFGFSAAPLVLGLILGPIAAENYTFAFGNGTAQGIPVGIFFHGMLSKLLVGLIIASVAYSFWMNVLGKSETPNKKDSKNG
ncbi:MAG: tripartite tricarboxylate transporter permease [Alphaproteobacteria bacterium]